MSSKSVTQRRGKIDSAGIVTASDIGTPGSANNGQSSSRVSTISLASKTSASSCPSVQSRHPVLRKNSNLTGSSGGLNSKTGGTLNNKASSSTSNASNTTTAKKPPQVPGKIVGHAQLKTSKSAPLVEAGNNKQEGEFNNGYCGEITAANINFEAESEHNNKQSSNEADNDVDDEGNKNLEKLSFKPDIQLNGGINPLPSGPIKHFLGRENGQQQKARSVPSGLGLCCGEPPTNEQESLSSSSPSPIVVGGSSSSGQLFCSPTCTGLHYCLQMIGTGNKAIVPVANAKPSTPTKYINGVSVNGGMMNGFGNKYSNNTNKLLKPVDDALYQEAFSHLLKIRNVLSESGMCSLEEFQHIASFETFLLRLFSKGGSKFQD